MGAVERISAAQECRGPDGTGSWHNAWAALGHRRLIVIDLSDAAAQPMVDRERGVALVFNGCIYNYLELREELSDGRPYRSTGDTEVVLRAYERWGDRFVDHLVGMFAIAIIDEQREAAIFVRDRLGIKPLYLASVPGGMRFASDMPALLAGGGVDTALDPVGLHHYLTWHSIVPAPRTVLAGVSKLPAATLRIVHRDGTCEETVYWQPPYTRDPDRATWSADDWEHAVECALEVAVRRRLVADVPVGVLLSGGLDSSILVALNARVSAEPVHTYSIGFDDHGSAAGDEFRYSDAVAERFGTDHRRLTVSAHDLPDAVLAGVDAMTEPMASHDVTAFYLLAEMVAADVKVVQCGQGADELFAGYGYHREAAEASRPDALPALRASFFDLSHEELLRASVPGAVPAEDVSGRLAAEHLSRPGAATALDAVLRLDTHLLMVDDPVKRVDNMTMAWSLEARVPFLDQDVVALAAACPPELKLADDGKAVLKSLGRRLLPREVVDRPKGYFPLPAVEQLRGPVLQLVRDALAPADARVRSVLRGEYLDRLLDIPDHPAGAGQRMTLWAVAVLEMWLQRNGIA